MRQTAGPTLSEPHVTNFEFPSERITFKLR